MSGEIMNSKSINRVT